LYQIENRMRSNPNISSMAVQMSREGDVVERLNNYKKEYEFKRQQKLQEMEQQCCNNPDCHHKRKEKQKVNIQESTNRLY